jgi:uncharacterized protein
MTYFNIIKITNKFVKNYMDNLNDISHDYLHILLVIKYAKEIAKKEGIKKTRDLFHIIMGALLHDVGDSKYTNENQKEIIKNYLRRFKKLKTYDKNEIIRISSNISLSKERRMEIKKTKRNMKLYIVQDADRINSLGSIGIMRYITYNCNNNKKPSFKEIISNMRKRTNKIKRFIKTNSGKEIAKNNYKIINDFINNYNNFI